MIHRWWMFSRIEVASKRHGQHWPATEVASVLVRWGEDAKSVDHRQECLDAFGSEPGDFLFSAFDG
jgi:hypothetical protein